MVGNVALPINTQNFKVEFQKIFLFFLTVFFCCDVGESDLVLKPRYGSFNVIYRKCHFLSVNELIVQKYLCLINSKRNCKVKCSRFTTALRRVDLVRLFLFVFYNGVIPNL